MPHQMQDKTDQPDSRAIRPDSTALDDAYRSWSDAAAAVLAKARRTTVAELPDTAEALLSVTTPDGLTIRPLYTRRDETPEHGLPGAHPFVRGADPARDVTLGWRVTERFGDEAGADRGSVTAASINADILDAMTNGASGLWLRVRPDGAMSADTLSEALAGVYLDLVPVTLDAGADGIAAARAFLDLRARADAAPAAATPSAATVASLGFSPLTAAFSGRDAVDAAAATEFAATNRTPGVRAFRVDGTDFATAGADNGLELGLTVAAAVAHLRDLTDAGLDVEQALGQITFAISADDDQFATIAKLRALRRIWSRVADVLGAADEGAALTHAVTDLSMYSQRDPWVNMLRSTIAAFGAGVGGADQVTVLGFDAAIPTDLRTSSARFSRRIARNTQLLLLEESNIGRVLDPAGGSWFVESLTDDVAGAAWAVFTDVEARGGYRAALEDGWVADRVAEALATRDVEVAHRRIAVTGVNEFPNLAENPLSRPIADSTDTPAAAPRLARVGRRFEELRDRSDERLAADGARPTVLLIPLGSIAEHNARTTFVANLLAAGGITAVNPGPTEVAGIAAAVEHADTPVAVICGTRQRYAEEGGDALAAARTAGLRRVLIAGPEADWPADAGVPDGTLRAGMDAIAVLTDLLNDLDTSTTHATTAAGAAASGASS
ncbi:methylmalonyl-CoA mutase small subunit [Gordonia sinesedis]